MTKAILRKAMGRRLRHLRKEQGTHTEDMARELGISASYLGLIERGTRGISAELLLRICRVLPCTADYMLTGTTSPHAVSENPPLLEDVIDMLPDKNARVKLAEFILALENSRPSL